MTTMARISNGEFSMLNWFQLYVKCLSLPGGVGERSANFCWWWLLRSVEYCGVSVCWVRGGSRPPSPSGDGGGVDLTTPALVVDLFVVAYLILHFLPLLLGHTTKLDSWNTNEIWLVGNKNIFLRILSGSIIVWGKENQIFLSKSCHLHVSFPRDNCCFQFMPDIYPASVVVHIFPKAQVTSIKKVWKWLY